MYAIVIWAAELIRRGVDGRNGMSGSVIKGQRIKYSRAQAHPRQGAMPRAKSNIHYHSMSGSFMKRDDQISQLMGAVRQR
ncbi:hypothetical protein N7494_005220 [Penicillium frequentans]|uniref:Uncharacterized protein n=1 Tax=Penicillium frequentans TaxID=3151616 RepID=A0AAD6D065_9EURO|nr:hypothetical protein N7494_005220 [Penicillium glabrum]